MFTIVLYNHSFQLYILIIQELTVVIVAVLLKKYVLIMMQLQTFKRNYHNVQHMIWSQ